MSNVINFNQRKNSIRLRNYIIATERDAEELEEARALAMRFMELTEDCTSHEEASNRAFLNNDSTFNANPEIHAQFLEEIACLSDDLFTNVMYLGWVYNDICGEHDKAIEGWNE
ncbi:MAG: hypothetical protein ACXWT1_05770 [Methylobacter sp.]